jgi:hypothetical protein
VAGQLRRLEKHSAAGGDGRNARLQKQQNRKVPCADD